VSRGCGAPGSILDEKILSTSVSYIRKIISAIDYDIFCVHFKLLVQALYS
jgi:hypothetical protein